MLFGSRMAVRPVSRCVLVSSRPALPVARRFNSNVAHSIPMYFTYETTAADQSSAQTLIKALKSKADLSNSKSYNAAVILGTPGLAKLLVNDDFVSEVTKFLSEPSADPDFHVLAAVVDHLAPTAGSTVVKEGVSILRGRSEDILPALWKSVEPRAREDADAVSTLTFGLKQGSISLPLAQTLFQNGRPSTLIAFQFRFTDGSTKIVQRTEPKTQHVALPHDVSIKDTQYRLPLIPLTHSRTVLESFGNIVRGVDVQGERTPASTELEEVVNSMYELLKNKEGAVGPVGVWALVTPAQDLGSTANDGATEPDPREVLKALSAGTDMTDLTSRASEYCTRWHRKGARLYKLLSGGGGWGQKKGLLSLDPQRSHFAATEEEDMQRFLAYSDRTNSDFAPPGSRIQFFGSAPPQSINKLKEIEPGFVFGVHGDPESSPIMQTETGTYIENHFGALSNTAVYIKASRDEGVPGLTGATVGGEESKITVPDSRFWLSVKGQS